jgi:acetyl esterase/lipase
VLRYAIVGVLEMKWRSFALLGCLGFAAGIAWAGGQDTPAENGPLTRVFAAAGGTELKAYVFSPRPREPSKRRAGIVLFHGGGWSLGEPAWAFSRARHFAELGLVAVAAQFRLSDQKEITPLEAMADAREAIRWMRTNADSLGIDPGRIAAYGWSSGAHLAASAAIFDDVRKGSGASAAPNALILLSPAVSLESDSWAQRLLGQRAAVRDISPDEHVRKGLPPTLILQGGTDTVTPLAGVRRFCERLRAAGNRCEMHVYDGFGHLFTPAGEPDDGWPRPDPAIQRDAEKRADRFLASLGFVN